VWVGEATGLIRDVRAAGDLLREIADSAERLLTEAAPRLAAKRLTLFASWRVPWNSVESELRLQTDCHQFSLRIQSRFPIP
jgi:hypothetical protein